MATKHFCIKMQKLVLNIKLPSDFDNYESKIYKAQSTKVKFTQRTKIQKKIL